MVGVRGKNGEGPTVRPAWKPVRAVSVASPATRCQWYEVSQGEEICDT